ncbi:hypothetical protein V8E54_011293, partial [Elaphomyces granulatus]
IFAACHLIGWDFLYPSVEQLLWRISSISCVVIPFLFSLAYLGNAGKEFKKSVIYLVSAQIFLYVLARIYLLVAIFTSLRSVPAGVYETVYIM